VGARLGVVLGKKSGLDSIRLKADELGLKVPESLRAAVLDGVKRRAIEKGGLLSDDEFRSIVGESGKTAAKSWKTRWRVFFGLV